MGYSTLIERHDQPGVFDGALGRGVTRAQVDAMAGAGADILIVTWYDMTAGTGQDDDND